MSPTARLPSGRRSPIMAEVLSIAVATFGRSDFSILRPLCHRLHQAPDFNVGIWVGGAHFEATSGRTVTDVEASGIPVWARIDSPAPDRSRVGTVDAMADQLRGFAAAATGRPRVEPAVSIDGPVPDLVIILGDRFEAVAAGLAMVPLGLPVAHISGGSVTEGAIDDVFRHCLTKIAAVHFCDLPAFARRIQLMGEPSERIITSGALGLDAFTSTPRHSVEELADRFDLDGLGAGYILATLHPETRAPDATRPMAVAMIEALREAGRQVVITYPNADPGANDIVDVIEDAVAVHDHIQCVRGFGADWFPTAMHHASILVGNSSGGIIEAASFGLPVVNIGDRQRGRDHGPNVIHCARDRASILAAVHQAKTESFRADAAQGNIYGDGRGAERVIAALRAMDITKLAQPKVFAAPDLTFDGELLALS